MKYRILGSQISEHVTFNIYQFQSNELYQIHYCSYTGGDFPLLEVNNNSYTMLMIFNKVVCDREVLRNQGSPSAALGFTKMQLWVCIETFLPTSGFPAPFCGPLRPVRIIHFVPVVLFYSSSLHFLIPYQL